MTHTESDLMIARLVEYGEAEAYEDMFSAAPAELALRVERYADALILLAPQLPEILFNRVMCLGLHQTAAQATIDELITRYRTANITNYAFQQSPLSQPVELPSWLHSRGLVSIDNWAKVYRTPDASLDFTTQLRVESITRRHAADHSHIVCTAFGMPPMLRPWLEALVERPGWTHYIAFDGESAVATSALFVRKGIGWLGIAGTLPVHRGKGGQGAMMARRIRDAAILGCDYVITETGESTTLHPNPSYRNMMRSGFQLAYQRPNDMPLSAVEI